MPSKFELNTYLNPREIPAGRRRIMLPDAARTIEVVEEIPDWYWLKNDRILCRTDLGLRNDLWLVTYFTCEERPDGTMIDTVYSLQEDHSQWYVIARAATVDLAVAQHATLRHAWWAGHVELRNLHERLGITLPAPGMEVLPEFPVRPPNMDERSWKFFKDRKERAEAAPWPLADRRTDK